MESREHPERDEQDRSIEERLDKLAEDIKRLPQERIDQLEKLVEKLAQSEVEKRDQPVKKKVLSIQEAAEILDLSKDTIRRAIKAGHLRAFQLNEGGNWRISIDEVERYMKGDRE